MNSNLKVSIMIWSESLPKKPDLLFARVANSDAEEVVNTASASGMIYVDSAEWVTSVAAGY